MGSPDIRIISLTRVLDEQKLVTIYTAKFEAPNDVKFELGEYIFSIIHENNENIFEVVVKVPKNQLSYNPSISARTSTENITVYMKASSIQNTLQTDFDISSCQYQLSQNITETSAGGYVITYQAIVTGCTMEDADIFEYFVVRLNGLDSIPDGTDQRNIDRKYTDKYFNQTSKYSNYDEKYETVVTCSINLSTMQADDVEIAGIYFNFLSVSLNFENLVASIRLQIRG
ncbi:uncharacterized protein LOC134723834 [Mytilus trossulus]|uniref:uncharacterized protein LOC134723834 n=1 Tax=Mytilus trossulus TaxID=6551 RepID=UPI003003FB19